MRIEREVKALKAIGRVGAAVTIAGAGFLGAVRPDMAYADINEPVRTASADGNTIAIAPFHTAGRAVDFYSPQAITACGVSWPGPVVLTVVANEGEMGLNATGKPEIYVDPIGLDGSDYPSRAKSADTAMRNKVAEVVARIKQGVRGVAVILVRDAGGQQVCDLISDTATETSVVTPAVQQPLATENCPGGSWQITDLKGKGVVSISGVPNRVTGNFDLADHGIFRSVSGLEALKNVLGEPGSFLADPNNIPAADKASWDAKVNAGLAEYIRTGGPNRNFFDLQSRTDYGVSLNPVTGLYEFNLSLPPHVILRIDAEEAKVFLASANGDRKIRLQMCQSGATRGVDFGHQTLFIRTPYAQGVSLRLESPTIPGTQVQIYGLQVQSPSAFVSGEAFLQGVKVRQDRADYPRYLAHTLNMNDLTLGSVESPAPGAPFQVIEKNYS